MKNKNIFYTLVLGLLIPQFSLSQELLKIYNPTKQFYNEISKSYQDVDLLKIKKDVIFYEMNSTVFDSIVNFNIQSIYCKIPFFENKEIDIQLNLANKYNNEIEITRHTDKGKIIQNYLPRIKTYKIQKDENNINGVFIFSKKGVKAIFSIGDNTYQLALLSQKNKNSEKLYFISNTKNSPIEFDFNCGHDFLNETSEHLSILNYRSGNIFGCIEIAIEIDYYTFQSFNDYQESVDWALEMLAVADAIYLEELELSITSNSAQIWETQDPYSLFVNDPQNMLISIRDNWTSDMGLSTIDRHLVHLFSKRNNTGTGGIAFLNGVGSSWNGYGFSSNLTDEEDYVDLPVPYFFWNIYCLVHELGHNFGAKHTQWCGWPEGPIDNCANIEEVFVGECSDYINNPAPQIGTIMSYCHTWPFESGGGIIIKFHDYVKEALIAYLGLQDLYACDNNIEVFGCLDLYACNYDSIANIDDGSCLYPELNLDCFGNCLNDQNENGICDEDEITSIYGIQKNGNETLFPNPANQFINIRKDNLSVDINSIKLFNSSGQLVFSNFDLNTKHKINISHLSSGIYSAHIIIDDQIKKQKIIIQ